MQALLYSQDIGVNLDLFTFSTYSRYSSVSAILFFRLIAASTTASLSSLYLSPTRHWYECG
jgi:hypothetical protein